jgi:hypothetical protein
LSETKTRREKSPTRKSIEVIRYTAGGGFHGGDGFAAFGAGIELQIQ